MNTFSRRLLGAARLDPLIYEEVEADRTAVRQALLVVLLSSVAGGVGVSTGLGITGIIAGFVASLIGWAFWACLIYLLGTKIFAEPQTSSNVGELLRTTGFAVSPGLIMVFGFNPGVFLVAQLWILVAMVIAVRQALRFHLHVAGDCRVRYWLGARVDSRTRADRNVRAGDCVRSRVSTVRGVEWR